MSYYYNFYPAIKRADGKIDIFNEKKITLDWYSRSFFNSDFLYKFDFLSEDQMTDALKEQFTYTDWNNEKRISELKIITKDQLMSLNDNFVKTGYFLIDDVKTYQQSPDDLYNLDIFYDHISPEIYAALLTSRPHSIIRQDCEGTDYVEHGAEDYMFFAYPDYTSDEYKAHKLKIVYSMIEDNVKLADNEEIVILEDEG